METAELTADPPVEGSSFGYSVALAGDRALIGAPGNGDAGTDSGGAYVFEFSGGTWTQTATLTASDTAEDDLFGWSVALDGDRVLVGAVGDGDAGDFTGSAYVFDLRNGEWTETIRLTASDAAERDYFGHSVALSGDRALIGAFGDDDAGSLSGSAHVFELAAGEWTEAAKLTASDAEEGDRFGGSVALAGDRALVGAHRDDDVRDASGSAYVFDLAACTARCTEAVKLTPDDPTAGARFGRSVALSGDRALVGATGTDGSGPAFGSAYVFDLTVGAQIARLTPDDPVGDDGFGFAVALSDERALVGAFGDDGAGSDAGSAYVFDLASVVPTEDAPENVALGAVSPNPTQGGAEVALMLAAPGEVKVAVYDALGRLVGSTRQSVAAGRSRVAVPVGGLAPGAYVVRVETPSGAASRRVTVVR